MSPTTFDSFITPDETRFDFSGVPVRRQIVLYAEKFVSPRGYVSGSDFAIGLGYKRRLTPGADLVVIDWETVSKSVSPRALSILAGDVRGMIRDAGFAGRVLATGLLSEGSVSRWWAFQDVLAADRYSSLVARVDPLVPAIRQHDGVAYQAYVPYADTSAEGLARLRCWLHGSDDFARRAAGPDKLAIPLVAPRYMNAAPPNGFRLLDPPVQKAIARFIVSRRIERVGLWDWAGAGYEVPGLSIEGTAAMIGEAVRQVWREVASASATLAPDPDGPETRTVARFDFRRPLEG